MALGGLLGSLIIGSFMDRFGRKPACILMNIPYIISWALTYMVSESPWPLYLASFISGLAGGMLSAQDVYLTEICHPNYRAMMIFIGGSFVSVGTMIVTVLVKIYYWKTTAVIMLLLGILSLIICFLLPESPIWLVTFNSNQKRLRKAENQVDKIWRVPWLQELEKAKILQIYHKNEEKMKSTRSMRHNSCLNKFKKLRLFRNRAVYYPTIILTLIFLFQQTSGIYFMLFYTRNLFIGLGHNFGWGLDEYTATVSVAAIRLLMTVIMSYVSLHVGRRKLLLISSLGMGGTILICGILQSQSKHTMNFTKESTQNLLENAGITGFITVINIFLYVLFASIAVLTIPWCLACEIFPSNVRGVGNGIISAWAFIVMFSVLKGVPHLLEIISLASFFYLLAVICVAYAVYIYFYLPETYNKTLNELEMLFEKK